MTNLFDYLFWRGDLSFTQDAPNAVDGMILARLSYFPWERLAVWHRPETVLLLGEAAAELLALPELEEIALQKEDPHLLRVLAESPRFREAAVSDFVCRTDAETQTQFSAVTLRLTPDCLLLAFRGTDNTLVGWKEDFNMGVVCPVPAQEHAVRYAEQVAGRYPGTLIFAGHSKGGNLAVYAAAFCGAAVQERIRAVYNYDGPGFDEAVLESEGYRAVCGRVHTFVPQSSVVGMLLGHREAHTIVHSEQIGLMQHNLYSWEVRPTGFACLQTVDSGSRFIDYTVKAWIQEMDTEQRERFVDTVYAVLSETQAGTLREMGDNWFASAKSVLKSVKNLDEPTRRAVTQALSLLAHSAYTGWTQLRQERQEAAPEE